MTTVNLQNNEIRLVFMNNRGEKESFLMDSKNSNLLVGEVIFTIPQDASTRIIEFSNKSFWINSYVNGMETVIYQGTFDNSANYEKWLLEKEKENLVLENKKEEINNIITNVQENKIVVSNNTGITASGPSNIQASTINAQIPNIIAVNDISKIANNGEVISEKKIDKMFFNRGITIRDVTPLNDKIPSEQISNDMVKDSNIKTEIKKTIIG